MFHIVVLIVATLLAGRGLIWIVQRLHDRNGFGRSFRHLMATGALSVSIYEGATWRTVSFFGKKHLRSIIARDQRRVIRQHKAALREAFLDSCTPTPYHYTIIFLIASVLGLVIETVYTLLMFGVLESRVGLVWGPFSPLYGAGAVLLTATLWHLRKRPWWIIFGVSALLGGILEQTTGWGMERFMHAQSWTYLGLPDHLTQWVAVRFLLMWGLIGLAWCRLIMPELIYRIGRPSSSRQPVLVALVAALLLLDILVTILSFYRAGQRAHDIPPRNPLEAYVDTHFDDRFMAETFENMRFGEPLPPASR